MYSIVKQNDHTSPYVVEYVADTEADIANLPTEGIYAGSTCTVTATSAVYMLNNSGTWVKQKQVSSSSSSDNGASSADLEEINGKIGDLTTLSTTDQTSLVNAVNEVSTNSAITITEDSSSSDYAKVYTITQNGTSTKINIPKDMVVSAGTVETNPKGQSAGTYLVLTLANATSDKIYINVGDLVDTYTAASGAKEVQLAISDTGEISASLVTGGIAKTKLATAVQTSLGKADTAVQKVESGSTNGTITVDGTDVAVKGLKSAAYTDSTAYATAAQGKKADSAVQKVATGTANGTIAVDGTDVAVKGLKSAAYTDSTAYDKAGAADAVKTALQGTSTDTSASSTIAGAKAYADEAVDGIYWTLEDEDTLVMNT